VSRAARGWAQREPIARLPRIWRHETVALDTGDSVDLKGSEVLWTSGPRSRGIVVGVIALLFMIGAIADLIGGQTSPLGSLVFAAAAAAVAARQTFRFLLVRLAKTDWELLLRSPQRKLLVREVGHRATPHPNPHPVFGAPDVRTRHETWREVSPRIASEWLSQRSRAAAEKFFPELAAEARRAQQVS
jgi:hypothetical protein